MTPFRRFEVRRRCHGRSANWQSLPLSWKRHVTIPCRIVDLPLQLQNTLVNGIRSVDSLNIIISDRSSSNPCLRTQLTRYVASLDCLF